MAHYVDHTASNKTPMVPNDRVEAMEARSSTDNSAYSGTEFRKSMLHYVPVGGLYCSGPNDSCHRATDESAYQRFNSH